MLIVIVIINLGGSMTKRLKIKKSAGICLAALIISGSFGTSLSWASRQNYRDIEKVSNWAIKDVIEARDRGFLENRPELNPKGPITRAEFVRLIGQALDLAEARNKKQIFKDVAISSPYFDYINRSQENNIVRGSGDYFRPNDSISRQEMASIIDRALELSPASDPGFEDAGEISNWAQEPVRKVAASGIMKGSGKKFDPRGLVSREMAIVISMRARNFDRSLGENEEVSKENPHEFLDIADTAKYLISANDNPSVGSMNGDWSIFGLARSNIGLDNDYRDSYYKNVESYVKKKEGKLHRVKYTEYSRLILSLSAIGKDPRNVGGYDLVKPLSDFNTLTKQGINGPVFALLALDSKNYEIVKDPEIKEVTSREGLIRYILDRQLADGGWNLGENAESSDVDITAMAIQALSNYKDRQEVAGAIDRGIVLLSSLQREDGSYESWQSSNSESISQVIVATTALGINPHRDKRFIKNGRSALDALLSFKDPSGGFYHIKKGEDSNGGGQPGQVDIMATDQAMYAMVAYNRLIGQQAKLYDMSK